MEKLEQLKAAIREVLELSACVFFDEHNTSGHTPLAELKRQIYIAMQECYSTAGGTQADIEEINDEMRAAMKWHEISEKVHERLYSR